MAHNPMDFNNDGKANYTDFRIHQSTMNQASTTNSSGGFSGLITIVFAIFIAVALFAISPIVGITAIVLCVLVVADTIYSANNNTKSTPEEKDIKPDGINPEGKQAVYPFQSEIPNMVICPKCKAEQKEGNHACWKCGTYFMYEE